MTPICQNKHADTCKSLTLLSSLQIEHVFFTATAFHEF